MKAGSQTPVHATFSMHFRHEPVQEHASAQSALQSCPMADGPMDDRTSTTQRATAAILSMEAIGTYVELRLKELYVRKEKKTTRQGRAGQTDANKTGGDAIYRQRNNA